MSTNIYSIKMLSKRLEFSSLLTAMRFVFRVLIVASLGVSEAVFGASDAVGHLDDLKITAIPLSFPIAPASYRNELMFIVEPVSEEPLIVYRQWNGQRGIEPKYFQAGLLSGSVAYINNEKLATLRKQPEVDVTDEAMAGSYTLEKIYNDSKCVVLSDFENSYFLIDDKRYSVFVKVPPVRRAENPKCARWSKGLYYSRNVKPFGRGFIQRGDAVYLFDESSPVILIFEKKIERRDGMTTNLGDVLIVEQDAVRLAAKTCWTGSDDEGRSAVLKKIDRCLNDWILKKLPGSK